MGSNLERNARGDAYAHQLRGFVAAVRGGAPLITNEDSLMNMRAIDAVYRKAGLTPRGI